ncbi:MAG: RNA methyltransferase [Chlamydiota bacterium]|nr:RNA methyltransferase [Chlamydiota bacterium]
MMRLTSRHNPKIKRVRLLKEKRHREREGDFLIEGFREIQRALLGGVDIQLLFTSSPLFLGDNEADLIASAIRQGAEILDLPPSLFDYLAYRDRPDGLLAIAKQPKYTLSQMECKLSENPLLLISESIEKPGNLGSMLRSCDGVGATAFISCDPATDLYNPNVVRASVGTLFSLPVIESTSEEVLAWLQERALPIVATSPEASAHYSSAKLAQGVAIAMGSEQVGLSEQWLSAASHQVSIPMEGIADSLNVASAATLLLYEAHSQRLKTPIFP